MGYSESDRRRMERLANCEVVEPVSRAMLPNRVGYSPLFNGAAFFVVVSRRHVAVPEWMPEGQVMVFAEGSREYRAFVGKAAVR